MNPRVPQLATVEREISQEIMKTDVFVKIIGEVDQKHIMLEDLNQAFDMFRDFEARFSRFRDESELSQFNHGGGGRVSSDLFELLSMTLSYHQLTNGIFDPSVLPVLEHIGYPHHSPLLHRTPSTAIPTLSQLILNRSEQSAFKPPALHIDLGGIGKGYIVDQVARFLKQRGYRNFVVDAGGDIFVSGTNTMDNYPYWAIDIENPWHRDTSLTTLLLSDEAVATSGRNRRVWKHQGQTKHHLIDPRIQDSALNDVLTVSVIGRTTVEADVWAKTLFILGTEHGFQIAEKRLLPALWALENGQLRMTSSWDHKVWKETQYQDIMESLCERFTSGSS